MAVAALVLLPVGAIALYLAVGSPTLPGQPLASRAPAERQTIEQMVAQVEAHLAKNPNEGRGWEVVAPIYLRMGRFEDAVKARRNALALNGPSAERHAGLGEALTAAADGVVTAEALAAFKAAVALDAEHVKARFFLGLAAEQDGRANDAVAIWRALLASAPPDAPWAEFVRGELAGSQAVRGGPAGPERGADRGRQGPAAGAADGHDQGHGRAACRAARQGRFRYRRMAAPGALLYGTGRARAGAGGGRRGAPRARRASRTSSSGSTNWSKVSASKADRTRRQQR